MLNSRDFADRQVIAAVHEYYNLKDKPYPIRPLAEPIQRGWRRSYVLSERALDRADRATLEAILKVIGSVVVHHDRNFHRRRGRPKKLFEIEQPLRPIPVHEWQRENYSALWQRYFQYQILVAGNQHWQPFWVFVHPSLYRLKSERNWITEIIEIDPETESRIGELDRWLEFHNAWHHYGRLKGKRQSYRCNHRKERLLDKEHRREISNARHIFPEVDPAASVWRIPTSLRSISQTIPGVAQCRGRELRPRPVQVRVLPPRLSLTDRVAQLAEARRRERRECWFKSSRDHPFLNSWLGQQSARFLTGSQR